MWDVSSLTGCSIQTLKLQSPGAILWTGPRALVRAGLLGTRSGTVSSCFDSDTGMSSFRNDLYARCVCVSL